MKAEFERVRTHIAARIAMWTASGEQYATAISGLLDEPELIPVLCRW